MSTTNRPRALPALNGIRAAACLMVVFGHAGYQQFVPIMSGIATTGVMVFFTLSGFLMAYHYNPDKWSFNYWLSFLGHRLTRVYPPFFFAPLGYWLLRPYIPESFPFGNGQPVWDTLITGWLLDERAGIFWTVPVEIAFYCIYPIIAAVLMFSNRMNVQLLLLSGSFYLLVILKLIFFPYAWFLSHFAVFLAGILAATVSRQYQLNDQEPSNRWMALALTAIAAFILLVIAHTYMNLANNRLWDYSFYIAPLVGILIISIDLAKPWVSWIFTNSLAQIIGKMSYSIYLMHFFVITAMRVYVPKPYSNIITVLIAVAIVSAAYFYLVERPFSKLAKKVGARIKST